MSFRLGKTPDEIRAMPVSDFYHLVALVNLERKEADGERRKIQNNGPR